MSRKEKIKFLILRSLGNFLLFMSIYGVVATFGPAIMQEVRYRADRAKGVTYTVKAQEEVLPEEKPAVQPPQAPAFSALMNGQQERILIPYDNDFSILIPKIGATAKVFPNVDPANEEEFKHVLSEGIAHAKGTVFPGIPGNTYLFAHSTDNWWNVGRYNAVFYLLKDLEKGDDVIIFFENRRHNYTITGKYVADPTEVSLLVNSRGDKEKLILQTCWPPGTTWKRLFIVAEPKTDQS